MEGEGSSSNRFQGLRFHNRQSEPNNTPHQGGSTSSLGLHLSTQQVDFEMTRNQLGFSIEGSHSHASSFQGSQRVVRRRVRGPSPSIRSPTIVERRRRLPNEASQRLARRRVRGSSPRIQSPTVPEMRRRLLDQALEALGIVRRVGGRHFQEQNALGEQLQQIQVIENGLTEDTIMAHLTRETYHLTAVGAVEHRACSICKDEYAEGDLLGKLDCIHDYHFECIKQWLVTKNSCPMCRHRALAI